VLPAVRLWTAWNEPNLTLGLVPQWRRVGGHWIPQSAVDYARICTAVADGIHATLLQGERVACGVTAARGNNNPRGKRQSVSPVAFLRAMKKAGAHGFDAYAHHPYPGGPFEAPSTRPKGPTAIGLGNIGTLAAEVTRLYGRLPIWITEYGYQTNPPDTIFGVSPKRQAQYLRQSYAIARANPRIDLMLWFLLQDEQRDAGWQSGLVSVDGTLKPAFYAFERAAASTERSSSGTTALPPTSRP
jgi:Glycosyl hydrolase catalytic core